MYICIHINSASLSAFFPGRRLPAGPGRLRKPWLRETAEGAAGGPKLDQIANIAYHDWLAVYTWSF